MTGQREANSANTAEIRGQDVLCMFCRERPATLHWGDMLSFTHGGGKNCCKLCCAEKQLAFARERAAAIPELEQTVADLRASLRSVEGALPPGSLSSVLLGEAR